MRSAVDQILAFNQGFVRAALQRKLERMTASPFTFFRATFHLFAYDLQEGWCRDRTPADVEGPIIGDLHTENFGAFRAITGDIVYDINDFDEVTTGSYEIDLRRLTTGEGFEMLPSPRDRHRTEYAAFSLARHALPVYVLTFPLETKHFLGLFRKKPSFSYSN